MPHKFITSSQVTAAAKRAHEESRSSLPYEQWLEIQKAKLGAYWAA